MTVDLRDPWMLRTLSMDPYFAQESTMDRAG